MISSPALRCTESVRPYAAAFGGSVEAKAALTVPDRPADHLLRPNGPGLTPLRPLFRDLVAAGQPAVVCLHRENLPLALAAGVLGARRAAPADFDPSLPKGGFLVLHMAGWRSSPPWNATSSESSRSRWIPAPSWGRALSVLACSLDRALSGVTCLGGLSARGPVSSGPYQPRGAMSASGALSASWAASAS